MFYLNVILSPGASEAGLGAAALAPLCVNPGGSAESAAESSLATFPAQAARWPFARNWTSIFVKNLLSVRRLTEATSMATQAVPKWSKGNPKEPKRTSKSVHGQEKDATQSRPTNHTAIYTKTRSTHTPPLPNSGRRILYIYICIRMHL